MKIFEKYITDDNVTEKEEKYWEFYWGNKINFVDENNVFVGFDFSSSCCENFGYMITREIPTSIEEKRIDIIQENYRFDTTFFLSNNIKQEELSDGGSATFKLVNSNDGDDVVYLTLYNCHNGYYSHGFIMREEDLKIQEGYL